MPVAKQTVITDALQSLRQDVQQEAADELTRFEGRDTPDGALGKTSLPGDNVVPDIEFSLSNPILSASRLCVLGFRIAERGLGRC
jgi:hypothetical protein